jgi:energy-coupling factor transport system ATP-binding protein
MPALELNAVSFTYPGSAIPAVDGVSLRLETGSLVALVGPNGSGKSTLAKIAAGLIAPQAGEVRVANAGSAPGSISRRVGLLFQNPDEQLLASSVVRELAWGPENLALPPDEMELRVRAGLERFGLTGMAELPPEALSDGQKQLTALAALMVIEPDFLILDEATAFLDPYWTAQVRRAAQDLARERGVLWITSRPAETDWADLVLEFSRGKIV